MAAATRISCLRAARALSQPRAQFGSKAMAASVARTGIATSSWNPHSFPLGREALQVSSRLAFHSSARKALLTPLPQRIEGTANDPISHPTPAPTHGSYHWTFERLVSAALIPLTIAPFASGSLNPVMDAVLCGAIVIHSHVGFQSVIIDYVPKKRMPKIRALFWWGLNAGTLLVAVGLYEFETNDVGVTEAIKKIWHA